MRRISNEDIPLIECDRFGASNGGSEMLRGGLLFDSLGVITDASGVQRVIVKILNFKTRGLIYSQRNTNDQIRYNYKSISKANLDADVWRLGRIFQESDVTTDAIASNPSLYQKYFTMTLADYSGLSKPASYTSAWSLSAGALTVPIKLRFDNRLKIVDFNKDISISAGGGLKYQPNPNGSSWILPYLAVGIVSISLDSTNTNGDIDQPSDRSGITLCTGIMYQSPKGVQLSLTGGWDYLRKREDVDWIDNGNFWVGFGIGMALFSESTTGVGANDTN